MRIIRAAALLCSLLVVSAQTNTLPDMLPGDVLFMDPSNGKPFMLIHAATGRIETLPNYATEQVYQLLLNRESACWDIHGQFVKGVVSTISVKSQPIIPTK